MKKLMIIGAGGQLGTELQRQLKKGGCTLGPVSYTHLDVYKRQVKKIPPKKSIDTKHSITQAAGGKMKWV